MRELHIGKNDGGQRLDKFLTKAVKGLPISLLYKYIRTKKIKVNGARAKQDQQLVAGDVVTLYIRDEFFDVPDKDTAALANIRPKLQILYEDENIILVDKNGWKFPKTLHGGLFYMIILPKLLVCSVFQAFP